VLYAVNISVARRMVEEYAQADRQIRAVAGRFQETLPKDLRALLDACPLSVRYYSAAEPEPALAEALGTT